MMQETYRHEDTPETTPEGGTTSEVDAGVKEKKNVATETNNSVENSTNKSVENDIMEKLQSVDKNNIKNVVNNLIKKYFDLDRIPSRERGFVERIIKTIEGIVNRLAKNGKLTTEYIKNLGKYFSKLTKLFYGEGNSSGGNDSVITDKFDDECEEECDDECEEECEEECDDKCEEECDDECEEECDDECEEECDDDGDNVGNNTGSNTGNTNNKVQKPKKGKKRRQTAENNGGETSIRIVNKKGKNLGKEQNEATFHLPNNLARFFGDFNDWNKRTFDNKTELSQYQEQIRNRINTESTLTKEAAYQRYDNKIKYGNFELADAMTYATVIGLDIRDCGEFKCFIGAVLGVAPNIANSNSQYMEKYNKFRTAYNIYYNEVNAVEDHIIKKVYVESLVAKHEIINNIAKAGRSYRTDFVNFTVSSIIKQDQPYKQNQSGLKIANDIGDVSTKLNHYKFKSDKSKYEDTALKYAVFNITFKNIFSLHNPIIKKLNTNNIDLRADLFNYGIYDQKNNLFNKVARDRYTAENLQNIGLSPEEIEELGRALAGLPNEIKNNYEILGENFYADMNNFEEIARIYALGEIIDNIKNLFANGEIFSDNHESGIDSGFVFDGNSADIVGDCLILEGKVNGTKTKIKYDLRTGKLYMNSFTQQEFNPPKITIGNSEPNTEIGDIGTFDDLLDGYQPSSFTRTNNTGPGKSYKKAPYGNNNRKKINIGDKERHSLKTLEILMKNKLLGKLSKIGRTVQEKAGEQSKENAIIDSFLKTFNILPDDGNPGTIEFLGGSKLYTLLESIKNTNDENHLLEFSKSMNDLMALCKISRGKNNLLPKDSKINSASIFDIDKKNTTTDIEKLKGAYDNFFSDKNGEKDKLSCKAHFDQSTQLSFANIIVDKCCRNSGGEWIISIDLAKKFVNNIKQRIDNAQKEKNDLIALGNIIDDDSTWT